MSEAIELEMTIEGEAELQNLLAQLPENLRNKGIKAGFRSAAKIVRDQVRALVPVESGELRNAIKISTPRQKKGEEPAILIGINSAAAAKLIADGKKTGKKPFYWVFEEYGWTDRAGGRHAGVSYLRRSLLSQKTAIENAVAQGVAEFIMKVSAK